MRVYWCLVWFVLLSQVDGQAMQRIAGHVLFRHGDRTPIRTYPTDSMKETDWPNGYGQLTSIGVEQHRRLGEYFRRRYGSVLSSTYAPNELAVRSTNYSRTVMSAKSNLAGLYPTGNRSNEVVAIPVHTVPLAEDFLLGESKCLRFDDIVLKVYPAEEYNKASKYYSSFFEKLQVWTNTSNITVPIACTIADTILIQHLYQKAPAWADETVRTNLADIVDLCFRAFYTDDDTQRIRGGPLVQDMWRNMNSARDGNSYHKLKMYSAHDSTIRAALGFLRIDCPRQPQYASALFIDLYKQNATYYVKVEYLNVTDSNKAYPYVLKGCPAVECPLDTFTAIYEPLFPGTADAECALKKSLTGYDRTVNTRTAVLSVVLIGLTVIGVGGLLLLYQRRTRHYALLSISEPDGDDA